MKPVYVIPKYGVRLVKSEKTNKFYDLIELTSANEFKREKFTDSQIHYSTRTLADNKIEQTITFLDLEANQERFLTKHSGKNLLFIFEENTTLTDFVYVIIGNEGPDGAFMQPRKGPSITFRHICTEIQLFDTNKLNTILS
jgi:hypothetical protein